MAAEGSMGNNDRLIVIDLDAFDLRLPQFVDPENPDEDRVLPFPLWIGDDPRILSEFKQPDANQMYNAWIKYYSPGDINNVNNVGLRLLWKNTIELARQTNPNAQRELGVGIEDKPMYGTYPNVSWLFLPWNLSFPIDELAKDSLLLEVNLWITIQFILHKRGEIFANPEEVIVKDSLIFSNRNSDSGNPIVPRVEDYHNLVLDDLWRSILNERKPLTGRQTLEKIAQALMPRGLHVNIRREWWIILRYTIENAFTAREDAYAGTGFPIRIKKIARHLRYHFLLNSGDIGSTNLTLEEITNPSVLSNPWARWYNNQGYPSDLRDPTKTEYTFFPLLNDEDDGKLPENMYLYTDESAALAFVGACVYCYARAAYSGVMVPYSIYIGSDISQTMGATNLPQHQRQSPDHWIEVVALSGRAAALRAQMARKAGGVPSVSDLRVLKLVRERLLQTKPSTDFGRAQKTRYLKWFSAVLRVNDRVESGSEVMREWAGIPKMNPDLYDEIEVANSAPSEQVQDQLLEAMKKLLLD